MLIYAHFHYAEMYGKWAQNLWVFLSSLVSHEMWFDEPIKLKGKSESLIFKLRRTADYFLLENMIEEFHK